MAVIRINKTSDYTVMSNAHFREKEMSLKAKGLLSLMLSLPDTWDYSINGLVAFCKENESAIKSTLNELKRFGYLEVKKSMPNETNSGRIEYEYLVYEQKQEGKKQGLEIQPLEIQPLEIQPVENHTQLNTYISNTKESNTNRLNTEDIRRRNAKEKQKIPPSVEDVRNYIHDNRLNVDVSRFMDYYESNGWKVGKTKMKDWQATLRNWNRRNEADKPRTDEIPSYDSSSNPEVDLKRLEGLRKV